VAILDRALLPALDVDEQELTELNSSAYQLMEPGHLIGATLGGRFVVEDHVGTFEGREVYSGRQPALERRVAIKLVHEASNQDLCRRFLREGRLLAKLDHPGIVSVIDVGEHDGRPYVVTDAPKGDTLETILDVRGRIDWRAAHDLLISLAEAVGSAHAAGLVHRDLHPRNIVVATDGQPRITDFVFAYETTKYTDEGVTQLLTSRGATVGSVEWVAPEQLMGFPVDMRADLYSLGVLGYRMVAGRTPYQAKRAAEVLSLQAEGATPLMVEAGLPESARPFAELIDHLLANEPDQRGFANASELARSLRQLRAMPMPEPDTRTEPVLGDTGIHPMRERATEIARQMAERAMPLIQAAITKAKALPLKLQLGIVSATLMISLGGLLAIASGEKVTIDAQPLAAAPAMKIDAAQLAIRSDARDAVAKRDVPRALHGYRTLAPEAFEDEDYQNVVAYLARPNRNTGVAESILISTAPASVPALQRAFEGDRSSRYLKRRAGEVLQKVGEPVDLVPLWIATLESDECGARKLAVRRLVESGDERAVGPLSSLGKSFSCGGEEARAGLRRMKSSG
jgi:tRNA A-37 threonylcarbamoyl transferase component Bud32